LRNSWIVPDSLREAVLVGCVAVGSVTSVPDSLRESVCVGVGTADKVREPSAERVPVPTTETVRVPEEVALPLRVPGLSLDVRVPEVISRLSLGV
jgi:hypothetical protein